MGTKHLKGRIPGFQPEREFAAEIGITYETQKKRRKRGDCPSYICVGRQVHISEKGKAEFFATKLVTPPRSGVRAVLQSDHPAAASKAAGLPRARERVSGVRLRA